MPDEPAESEIEPEVTSFSVTAGGPTQPDDEPPGGLTMPAPALSDMPQENVYIVPDDSHALSELEATVNLTGDSSLLQKVHDHLRGVVPVTDVSRSHLRGLLEALVFASDKPQKASDLAKVASANVKEVKELLGELQKEYQPRGIQLDEVAGGWVFRTSSAYAPFVRDLTKQKPVRLSRAQIETLAILAYRQPVTRPEIDDIRGVDSGPVLKVLLERDLVRILGKKDEPGRPMIYGTTSAFLEFFGLKSLKDLPTLREFTELSEDSRRVAERELGEVLEQAQPEGVSASEVPPPVEVAPGDDSAERAHDTVPPAEAAEAPAEEPPAPDAEEPEGA